MYIAWFNCAWMTCSTMSLCICFLSAALPSFLPCMSFSCCSCILFCVFLSLCCLFFLTCCNSTHINTICILIRSCVRRAWGSGEAGEIEEWPIRTGPLTRKSGVTNTVTHNSGERGSERRRSGGNKRSRFSVHWSQGKEAEGWGWECHAQQKVECTHAGERRKERRMCMDEQLTTGINILLFFSFISCLSMPLCIWFVYIVWSAAITSQRSKQKEGKVHEATLQHTPSIGKRDKWQR